MGAYLSSPITEKISSDKLTENYSYGASTMQGWRKTQEDAHNCCPDFDEESNTSYFAVYDGHGGAEVAQYCALHLPKFLRSTEAYKNDNLSQALEDAFLGFDATLTEDEVVKELKTLAEIDDDMDEVDVQEEIEETVMLNEEAKMPLEEVLAKYGGRESLSPAVREIYKKNEKLQSPALKAKKEINSEGSSTEPVAGSTNSNSLNCTVGSDSSAKQLVNGHSECEIAKNAAGSATSSGSHVDSGSEKISKDSDLQEQVVCSSDSDSKSEKDVLKSGVGGSGEPMAASSTGVEASNSSGPVASCSAGSSSNDAPGSSSGTSTSSASSSQTLATSEPQAGGSGLSSIRSSDADPQPSSSGGSTHKIPDESESSCSSDDDDSSEEEEDSDDFCEADSEDEEEEEGEIDDGDEDGPMFSTFFQQPGANSGSTAVIALLRDRELYVANAGDSRCIVCRDGEAVDMSIDHKPDDEAEKARITAAGGKITWDGRVNGGLNLSRAIGDHIYKKTESLPLRDQMISSLPDVKKMTLEEKDEFMVLACDGIWNFMTSAEVVAYVKERIDKVEKLSSICEEMFTHCLAADTLGDGTGCDNMTCIIIKFHFKEESRSRKRSALDDTTEEESASKKCKVDSAEEATVSPS